MDFVWEEGFEISVRVEGDAVVISANREGLRSLAEQLAALAQEELGDHLHYDQFNSLEDGSTELIVELA